MKKYADFPPKLLVFGCGYLGIRVARQAVSAGHIVWATTRNPDRAQNLAAQGIGPLVLDWNDRRTLRQLPQVDRVLVAVSYDPRSGFSRHQAQVGGLSNLLSVLPESTQLCYISTTGVYHQCGGVWVDESSPARPRREGGRAHLRAENLLHRHRPAADWTILRLAGIYGPDRLPRVADVIAGHPIRSPANGYLNLIHVDDAADVVQATWDFATERRYVVADDCPVVRGEFYHQIARQIGAPPPTFEHPEVNAAVRMRSDSNKRVWNRRMKRDLVPRLRFPSYREGLAEILGSTSS
ncbi:MAG: SDR family oxidoreductase [Pirellulales bacterium]|nr:SDR family oxidoreductase [Pirellulales bacterium]